MLGAVSTKTTQKASRTDLELFVAGELRAHLGRYSVSRSELARRLDVDNTWVGKRLSGETAITLGDLQRMAQALGVVAENFLPSGKPVSSLTGTKRRRSPVDPLAARVVATVGEARTRRAQPSSPASARSRETAVSHSRNRPVTSLPT
jgi:transcriptional regulator with XRE-family HTH domain